MKLFKRMMAALAAVVLVVTCLPSQKLQAEDEVKHCGDNLTWKLDGYTLTISGTGPMYDFESTEEQPWYGEVYTRLVVESGVTHIGRLAFAYNQAPTLRVTLSDTVGSIGDYAFSEAPMVSLAMPESVKKIGERAFESTSLTSIDVSKVTSIGAYAFADCRKLKGTVTIGKSVSQNLDNAFWGCPISAFKVASGNKKYKSIDGVLYNKKGTELISFPKAKKIKTFIVPDTVKVIGENALANAHKVTNLIIPDSVKTIETGAFPSPNASYPMNAKVSLKKIYIGKGLKNLGVNVFYPATDKINYEVYFTGDKPEKTGDGAEFWTWFAPVEGGLIKVYYPEGNKTWDEEINGEYTADYYHPWFKVPVLSSVKNTKAKKATVKWKKSSGVTGYEIQYATNKKFKSAKTKTVKGVSKNSVQLSKLKKGKTFYVRVRAYKSVGGVKYYTGWSKTKSVKIKK